MSIKLTLYHKLVSALIFAVSIFLVVRFGWTAYSTITERAGLNGNMYILYHVSRLQFSIYTCIVALVGLFYVVILPINVIQHDTMRIHKLIRWFLVFMLVFVICEVYLQIKYIAKG